MRVPKDVRPLYGKKEIIRKSLKTSDRGEAISRVRFEAFKLDSEFAAKRRELKTAQPLPTLGSISDKDAHDLVFRWFIHLERLSQDWWDKEGRKFDEVDKAEVLENLRIDEVVYGGGSRDYRPEDASSDLDAFLISTGLECPKDSSAYAKLVSLFTKARLENIRRDIARATDQTVSSREPLYYGMGKMRGKQIKQMLKVKDLADARRKLRNLADRSSTAVR